MGKIPQSLSLELGQMVSTPRAMNGLEQAQHSLMELLIRHVSGDWGEHPEEDIKENELSIEGG